MPVPVPVHRNRVSAANGGEGADPGGRPKGVRRTNRLIFRSYSGVTLVKGDGEILAGRWLSQFVVADCPGKIPWMIIKALSVMTAIQVLEV